MANLIFRSYGASFYVFKPAVLGILSLCALLSTNATSAELAAIQLTPHQIKTKLTHQERKQVLESSNLDEIHVAKPSIFNRAISIQKGKIEVHSERFIKARHRDISAAEAKLRKAADAAQKRSSEGVKALSGFR